MPDPLARLGIDIFLIVLDGLPLTDIVSASAVSTSWSTFLDAANAWRRAFLVSDADPLEKRRFKVDDHEGSQNNDGSQVDWRKCCLDYLRVEDAWAHGRSKEHFIENALKKQHDYMSHVFSFPEDDYFPMNGHNHHSGASQRNGIFDRKTRQHLYDITLDGNVGPDKTLFIAGLGDVPLREVSPGHARYIWLPKRAWERNGPALCTWGEEVPSPHGQLFGLRLPPTQLHPCIAVNSQGRSDYVVCAHIDFEAEEIVVENLCGGMPIERRAVDFPGRSSYLTARDIYFDDDYMFVHFRHSIHVYARGTLQRITVFSRDLLYTAIAESDVCPPLAYRAAHDRSSEGEDYAGFHPRRLNRIPFPILSHDEDGRFQVQGLSSPFEPSDPCDLGDDEPVTETAPMSANDPVTGGSRAQEEDPHLDQNVTTDDETRSIDSYSTEHHGGHASRLQVIRFTPTDFVIGTSDAIWIIRQYHDYLNNSHGLPLRAQVRLLARHSILIYGGTLGTFAGGTWLCGSHGHRLLFTVDNLDGSVVLDCRNLPRMPLDSRLDLSDLSVLPDIPVLFTSIWFHGNNTMDSQAIYETANGARAENAFHVGYVWSFGD